jgi:hypothetical protein
VKDKERKNRRRRIEEKGRKRKIDKGSGTEGEEK